MVVYTIGHSTSSTEHFVGLLKQHDISAIGDVRSQPYSRFNPQFNREELKNALGDVGISYVFLGQELGARSDDPNCYESGKVNYDRLAESDAFQKGLARVKKGATSYRLALMCAEKEPLDCHRTILIARYLEDSGIDVHHILWDGSTERHDETIARLTEQLALSEDMFKSADQVAKEAYDLQGFRIAYEPSDYPRPAPQRVGDAK